MSATTTRTTTMTMSVPLRPLPEVSDLIHFDQAVAGHDGTLSDASGELFIKPATTAESTFYQQSIANHSEFAYFMPTFLGTLSLSPNQNSTLDEQGASLIAKYSSPQAGDLLNGPPSLTKQHSKIKTDQAIVLENAAFDFKKANILDVKLGVRLWADDAREEKKIRFDKITAQTTHKNLGFRIAGMRVWQGEPGEQDNRAQDYGHIDKDGFRIFDKDFGRVKVNDDNIAHALQSFFFCETAGVDEELGKLVLEAFLTELEQIQDILENQESRMFSASLLFVYEGDGNALRFAMEEASKEQSEEEEEEEEEEVDNDAEEEDEDRTPKIYALKVIDFAHAEWVPGHGPDENSLHGIRSIRRILEGL